MIHYMFYRSHTELMPSDGAYRRILDQARTRNFKLDAFLPLHDVHSTLARYVMFLGTRISEWDARNTTPLNPL